MNSAPLSRRRLLSGATASALAAAGLTSLTACGGAASSSGGAAKSAKFRLPTRTAAAVAPPDIPGGAGYDPTYLRFPKKLVKAVGRAPGDGKRITFLGATWTTPMPPPAKNRYLHELNRRLGSELDMNITDDNQTDGYMSKFNAVVASGDLPDLVWFPPNGGNVPKLPQLLPAKFHDLTEHLSGSAVHEFPNLANLPTDTWRTAVVDGALWGAAIPYGRLGQAYIVNQDFWKPVGGARFDSAQDFLDKGKELLDAKRKHYVLEPGYLNHLHMFGEWFGAPNQWRLHGGKLQSMYETDEYRAALEFTVKVFRANLFWPDANLDFGEAQNRVAAGTLGAFVNAYPGYRGALGTADYPIDLIVPFPAVKGAKPGFDLGNNSLGWCAVSKRVPTSRIKTLLRVLDYMAAPFGTEERKFLEFGAEGYHHTVDKDGDPVLTTRGQGEVLTTVQPIHGMGQAPEVMYAPGHPDRARRAHDREKQLAGMLNVNPTAGHYSDTQTAEGASLTQELTDTVTDIVTGRKPMSAFDGAVRKWRRGGGDRIRGEYEKAIAADR